MDSLPHRARGQVTPFSFLTAAPSEPAELACPCCESTMQPIGRGWWRCPDCGSECWIPAQAAAAAKLACQEGGPPW